MRLRRMPRATCEDEPNAGLGVILSGSVPPFGIGSGTGDGVDAASAKRGMRILTCKMNLSLESNKSPEQPWFRSMASTGVTS